MNWLLVFIGGGIGSMARFGITGLTKQFFNGSFPLATLIANVLSCLIMGLVLHFSPQTITANWKLLLLTGLCGGFSTFSSFSFENVELAKQGNWTLVVLNILVSIIACFLIIYFLSKQPSQ